MFSSFSLEDIEEATGNFDEKYVVGKGGEAKVYRAQLILGRKKTEVAVKHLKPNASGFEDEVKIMPKIQHPNIVSLLGYCNQSGQKILIYEYMANGSLADYIQKKRPGISLSWQQRLKISLGAAFGLQHLHIETQEFPKGIIHRDVKPDNILLDTDWVAKISDFGMFKLSQAGQIHSAMVTNLKGTGGYYAPEYVTYLRVTRKIDVYAFGVVLFQILCRKSPWYREDESYDITDDHDVGIWAQQNVDPEIKEQVSDDCLKAFTEIIGKCLKVDPRIRPTMDQVVLDLQNALNCQERDDEAKKPEAATEAEDRSSKGSRPKGSSSQPNVNDTGKNEYYGNPIVLDIGGAIIKAGFAEDDGPSTFVASQLGQVGSLNGSLSQGLINPVKDGIVFHWANYQKIVHHALYNELGYDPDNKRPVLLTEPPLIHNASDSQRKEYRTNRENMTDVMFSKFDVPALYIGMQPVLSLFSIGETTGIVVESGEGISHSVPIYEGHALPHAITGLNLAGRGLTDQLAKILNEERGYSFSTQAEHEIVREVKEKMFYIALNYKMERRASKNEEESYTLPDGKLITLGTERFKCPEALFHPSIAEMDEPGIHKNTIDSITMCDEDIRKILYGNMVLSGGTTKLRGFKRRLQSEIERLAPRRTEIKILAPSRRNYCAWIGGCILASLSVFPRMLISKEEFEECGPSVVHKKCI